DVSTISANKAPAPNTALAISHLRKAGRSSAFNRRYSAAKSPCSISLSHCSETECHGPWGVDCDANHKKELSPPSSAGPTVRLGGEQQNAEGVVRAAVHWRNQWQCCAST